MARFTSALYVLKFLQLTCGEQRLPSFHPMARRLDLPLAKLTVVSSKLLDQHGDEAIVSCLHLESETISCGIWSVE